MSNLSDLKIAELRDINASLGIPNRKSRVDNVNQITYHLKKSYNFNGPFTLDAINDVIAKGPLLKAEGNIDNAGSDINVIVDQNKLVTDLVDKGILKPNQIGDPNVNINKKIEDLYITGVVNVVNYQHSDDDDQYDDNEEEESPDPAARYRDEEEDIDEDDGEEDELDEEVGGADPDDNDELDEDTDEEEEEEEE